MIRNAAGTMMCATHAGLLISTVSPNSISSVITSYSIHYTKLYDNAAYLIDVLSHIDSEESSIMLSNATRAIIIQPVKQKEDEKVIMLVMPVRLSS